MADQPPYDRGDDSGGEIRESPPGIPRWLKLLGIALVIVILLAAVAMLILGGHTIPAH